MSATADSADPHRWAPNGHRRELTGSAHAPQARASLRWHSLHASCMWDRMCACITRCCRAFRFIVRVQSTIHAAHTRRLLAALSLHACMRTCCTISSFSPWQILARPGVIEVMEAIGFRFEVGLPCLPVIALDKARLARFKIIGQSDSKKSSDN